MIVFNWPVFGSLSSNVITSKRLNNNNKKLSNKRLLYNTQHKCGSCDNLM